MNVKNFQQPKSLSPAVAGAIILVFFAVTALFFSWRSDPKNRQVSYSADSSVASNSNFQRFQQVSEGGIERRFILRYELGQANHLQVTVNPQWYSLPAEDKAKYQRAIWGRWTAINSPNSPRQSTLSIFAPDGTKLGHTGYNTGGEWEEKTS